MLAQLFSVWHYSYMPKPQATSKTFSFYPVDSTLLASLRRRIKPDRPRKGRLTNSEIVRKALRALDEKESVA